MERHSYERKANVTIETAVSSTLSLVASSWKVRVFERSTVRFLDEGQVLSLPRGTVSVSRSSDLQEIRTPSVTIGLEGQADLVVGYPTHIVVAAGIITITSRSGTVTVRGAIAVPSFTVYHRQIGATGVTGVVATLLATGGDSTSYRFTVVAPTTGYTITRVESRGTISATNPISEISTLFIQVRSDYTAPRHGNRRFGSLSAADCCSVAVA